MLTNSKQPRKQRKARFEARLHERQHLAHAHISKELRAKLKTKRRSIEVRKGDRVKILRGEHKGKSGKVTRVDLNDLKIYVEGALHRKAKGNEVPAPVDPSNVVIVDADFGDKWRKKILERSAKVA